MQNYKLRLVKINSFVSKKKSLIIFLLLLIGVFVPGFSGTNYLNFWDRLITIITNPFFNFMLFISVGYGLIMMLGDNFNCYNIVLRYKDYKSMINDYAKDVVCYSIYLTIISFLLAIAGAIVLSFGNYQMISYLYYDIPVIYYIIIQQHQKIINILCLMLLLLMFNMEVVVLKLWFLN